MMQRIQHAGIKIDPDRVAGEVDRISMAILLRTTGCCVYDSGNLLSDEKNYGKDVMAAAKIIYFPLLMV